VLPAWLSEEVAFNRVSSSVPAPSPHHLLWNCQTECSANITELGYSSCSGVVMREFQTSFRKDLSAKSPGKVGNGFPEIIHAEKI